MLKLCEDALNTDQERVLRHLLDTAFHFMGLPPIGEPSPPAPAFGHRLLLADGSVPNEHAAYSYTLPNGEDVTILAPTGTKLYRSTDISRTGVWSVSFTFTPSKE